MTEIERILRRIVATTPCTCAGWPHDRCLICQATDALNTSSVQCCATMRDRAVEAIEREIASVQKIRRLSEDERTTAVEFLTYAANHVRALEVK